MSLVSNVTARYSSQRLVELTNADDQAATTVDSTVLGLAGTDVEADFAAHGITYDDSDARHVAVGVEGVIARLTEWMGTDNGSTRLKAYLERLDKLRMVTANDRIQPGTGSLYQSTVPGDDGSTVRPPFDGEHFGGIELDAPRDTPPVISDEDV